MQLEDFENSDNVDWIPNFDVFQNFTQTEKSTQTYNEWNSSYQDGETQKHERWLDYTITRPIRFVHPHNYSSELCLICQVYEPRITAKIWTQNPALSKLSISIRCWNKNLPISDSQSFLIFKDNPQTDPRMFVFIDLHLERFAKYQQDRVSDNVLLLSVAVSDPDASCPCPIATGFILFGIIEPDTDHTECITHKIAHGMLQNPPFALDLPRYSSSSDPWGFQRPIPLCVG